jgi:predicted peroxiredoxin
VTRRQGSRFATEADEEPIMRARNQALLMSILVLALLAALSGALQADEHKTKTLFYNLTTDDSWASGMALGQAAMALQNGYQVVVFLNVRGVYLAQQSRAQDTFSGTGKTAHEMLASLREQGARVIICPMCMKKAAIADSDLVPGVEIGGPKVTFPLMTADDTVVLSY